MDRGMGSSGEVCGKPTILDKLAALFAGLARPVHGSSSDAGQQKIRFLTFANTAFMGTGRVVGQARESGFFDEVVALTEYDIGDYIARHRDFIDRHPEGYGLWIWKPRIIHDALEELCDGDILVYADAGTYINKHGADRFRHYLRKLRKYDLVTFATSRRYRAQYYVKQDAVMACCPEFARHSHLYCYAGLMIIRNSASSRRLIAEWFDLCQQYRYLDRSPSVEHRDPDHYRGNDCDCGLFNLCLFKHGISYAYYPDEVNICLKDGRQYIHTDAPYQDCDWSPLDHVPFQCRRMTPAKGFVEGMAADKPGRSPCLTPDS